MTVWPGEKLILKEAFERDGFAIIKSLFDEEETIQLRDHLARYMREVVPGVPPMDVFYEDKSTRDKIRMLPRMDQHDEHFRRLLTDSRLREIAEFLWGCDASPQDVAFFNKPARVGEPTPPHQDGYYFHLEPCEALTLWLALERADEENGCVSYVAGSHRDGMRPHAATHVLGFSQGITDFGVSSDRSREVLACVDAGDVIVHDALTVHRAAANRSPRDRPALGFVYFSSRAQVDTAARDRYHAELENKLRSEAKI